MYKNLLTFEFISAQDEFNCRLTASSFPEFQFPLDRVEFGLSNNPKSFSPFVSRGSAQTHAVNRNSRCRIVVS